jgi:hypothetical protein
MLFPGLALNVLVLLRHTVLTRADVLLGAIVFFAGVVLLGLTEYRRRKGGTLNLEDRDG